MLTEEKTVGKISRSEASSGFSQKEASALCKDNRGILETTGIKNSALNFGNNYHLVTSLNIDTPHNKRLFKNMQAYADWIEANTAHRCYIHVIPTFYRTGDPTNYNDVTVDHDYIRDGILKLNGTYEVICNADVSITNVNPLTGMTVVGSAPGAIIPHPRVADEVTTSVFNNRQRHLLSTLTIGEPRYRRGNVGTKAVRHHVQGFTVVEPGTVNNWSAARHVTSSDDGSFSDMLVSVRNGKVRGTVPVDMVLGDFHIEEMDIKAFKKVLPFVRKIGRVVAHDLLSFSNTMNHHERAKPLYRRTQLSVSQEIAHNKTLLENLFKGINMRITNSNHDDSLDRWLDFGDAREIPTIDDIKLWHELHLFRINNPGTPLMTHLFGLKVLDTDNNAETKGWSIGHHGHKWGSSAAALANTVGKSISGHTHKGRRKGAQISVGSWIVWDRPNYAKGSVFTWSRADAIIHEDKKAQLLRLFTCPVYSKLHTVK